MYVRAYSILQKDFESLTEFIECADQNLEAYSFRIHALLVRAAIEVEANLKAILHENAYGKAELTMADYKKIELSHKLSGYRVKIPHWRGNLGVRQPFLAWSSDNSLPWYKVYNAVKHDRHRTFSNATFEHCLDSICGLLVLLTAQFLGESFSPGSVLLALENCDPDGFETAIGEFFRIKYPDDWDLDSRYEFDWSVLRREEDPLQNFPYAL